MALDKMRVAVLACSSCGAPMHPDSARQAFYCPYCGNTVPYSDHTLQGARPLVYKHHDVPVEDGLLKLIRVTVLSGVHEDLKDRVDPGVPEVRWARSFEDYVASIDRRAYVTRRDRFEFTFFCPHCGGEVEGSSTQTMYECGHCKTVFGLDDLANMGLDALPQIVGNNSMVPSKCLPFKVGLRQAQARIRYLVSQNPDVFAGSNVEALLQSGRLVAVYTPALLCDLALRVTTDSNLGEAEFYMEWIDWTLPRDTGLDLALIDRMQPWDFNEAGAFIPDLVMGDVIICAATNFADKIGVINALAARGAAEEIERCYGARRLSLIRWSRDLVEHQQGLIALPVYYLEQHDGAGGGVRIMVNGQTAAVQAIVREGGVERACGLPGSSDGRIDGERTMRSAPVPVRYEKPSHLYRVLSPEEAFGRRVHKMGGTAAGEAPTAQSGRREHKKGLFGKLFS